MGIRASRQRARRLRFENLEARRLLTGLAETHAWALHQDPAQAGEVLRMTSALQDSSRRSARSRAEGESSDVPALVSPLQDTVVDGATVTLKFEPLPGYSGPYMVRLSDTHWNGRQAPGFTHDTNQHYLSIATTSTQITVPVEPGEVYGWWVHKPGYPAAGARFSVGPGPVAPPTPPPPAPTPNVPTLVSPLQNEVIAGTSVTLKFEPLPGYSGPYMVRLSDTHWNGQQASGFVHDTNQHYLSIATTSTEITVPVEPGEVYGWWVHKPGFPAAGARFSVGPGPVAPPTPPPPAPTPNVPTLVSPLQNEVIKGTSVTLKFEPLPGYSGPYMVRLSDTHWNGQQAPGFAHDTNQHYLSIATTSTQITVPVEPGEVYGWWVHKPGFPAAGAKFSVEPGPVSPPAPSPDVPTMISPLADTVVTGASVTLKFEPLPGYTGDYLVRLDDAHWNGRQATGFVHDSTLHYLSITTKSTEVTLPVEPGESYRWWVHKPGFPAARAAFTTSGIEIKDPELIDGRYRATAMEPWEGTSVDVAPILQHCVDQVPIGATLELPVGRYRIGHQVVVNRRIVLTSVGKSLDDPAVVPGNGDAAHLIANPELDAPFGMLYLRGIEAMHHIIVDGNKEGRLGTSAHQRIINMPNNQGVPYGFNALLECDDALLMGNVFQNALAGTGLGVRGTRQYVVIRDNKFLDNGWHNRQSLWADGLTVKDISYSQIVGNEFRNNTDIDLIFGGAQNSLIQNNTIVHTGDIAGGSFAGLMIHKWSNSSGDYSGTDISGNVVDGGPNRNIGSGIYVASEGWYNETPYGWTTDNLMPATIHGNVSRNVQNGMYVAARGFSIFENEFQNAHGVAIPTSRGVVSSNAPIVVSPTTSDLDFRNENVAPTTRHLFESQSWIGRIPNWPF